MTQQQHPITPPPELVEQWATINGTHYEDLASLCGHIATRAGQWGADQELEACQQWLVGEGQPGFACQLRAARRPKPPSLAEEAWMVLAPYGESGRQLTAKECDTIRHALERLQKLEGGQC